MSEPSPDSPPPPAPPRRSWLRFFRFRLRTFLILAPLVTFLAAYGLRAWYLNRVQAWAVERVEAADGVIFRNERGDVNSIQFPQLTMNDKKLAELLPALQVFPALESIILYGNEVTDEGLAPLVELPALKKLYLADTHVSAEGVQRMKERNPNLQIDVKTRSPKASSMARRPIFEHALLALATTVDGRLASGSADGKLRFWDLRRTSAETVVKAHQDWTFAVTRHPRLPQVVTGGGDSLIKFWDAKTGREVGRLEGHTDDVHALAFTPDGRTLVSSADDKTIRIWDVAARRERFVLSGHDGTIPTVAVSPNGELAASGSRDDTIRLWNIATGEFVDAFTGHTNDVMHVDFSPSGRELASVSYDGTLKLWDVAERREIDSALKHGDRAFAVRWSPDGTRLLTAAGDGVRCFRRNPPQLEWHEERGRTISAVHWLDDKRLATASVDGLITIRDDSGRLLSRLTALVDR